MVKSITRLLGRPRRLVLRINVNLTRVWTPVYNLQIKIRLEASVTIGSHLLLRREISVTMHQHKAHSPGFPEFPAPKSSGLKG